jgi:hypothetical protein
MSYIIKHMMKRTLGQINGIEINVIFAISNILSLFAQKCTTLHLEALFL